MEAIAQDSPAPVDPAVYRDLLIFEESLRSQYLQLQNRRRKYLGTRNGNTVADIVPSVSLRSSVMVSLLCLRYFDCP